MLELFKEEILLSGDGFNESVLRGGEVVEGLEELESVSGAVRFVGLVGDGLLNGG